MALEALDILAAWSELETNRQVDQIKLAMAAVLNVVSATETEVTITRADMAELLQEWIIESSVSEDGASITVKLVPLTDAITEPSQGDIFRK